MPKRLASALSIGVPDNNSECAVYKSDVAIVFAVMVEASGISHCPGL
jgi:hypothetical protein